MRSHVEFTWIRSHLTCYENNSSYRLAKLATISTSLEVYSDIPLCTKEAKNVIYKVIEKMGDGVGPL